MLASTPTISQWLREQLPAGHTHAILAAVLTELATAAKQVHDAVNRAPLMGLLGAKGSTNIQGEDQQKLDVVADETFLARLSASGQVAAVASEEVDDYLAVNPGGQYVVLIDPLDGSSNIDVNGSIGTIFALYQRASEKGSQPERADCLQAGTEQVAAGYVLYSTCTQLVLTLGEGVHLFTLDPHTGEFWLTKAQLRFPEKCLYYSLNDGERASFLPAVQAYLQSLHTRNAEEGAGFKARYQGALVGDFHRNLLKGGIFLYPGTVNKPAGKLRLLYEGNPMAFLAEQAGGAATTGTERILAVQPTELHQRVPLIIGHAGEVHRLIEHHLKNQEAHKLAYGA